MLNRANALSGQGRADVVVEVAVVELQPLSGPKSWWKTDPVGCLCEDLARPVAGLAALRTARIRLGGAARTRIPVGEDKWTDLLEYALFSAFRT